MEADKLEFTEVVASITPSDPHLPDLIPIRYIRTTHLHVSQILSQRAGSPFVYRDGVVDRHSPHTFTVSVAICTESGTRLHERVYTYDQNIGMLQS